MKLSNLSLAVLVALGVAACGGSDDNNNAPQDPPAGNGGGNNGGGNTTPPPAVDNTKPQDPARVAPGNDVQDAVKPHVQTAKTTYASAGARDLLIGYAPNEGIAGAEGNNAAVAGPYANKIAALNLQTDWRLNDAAKYEPDSTDAENVKRLSSMVNYVETNQLRTDAAEPAYNGSVLANPGFTYAKGVDGKYYRMIPVGPDGVTQIAWDQTKPSTLYIAQDQNNRSATAIPAAVSQDKLVFIPNVKRIDPTVPAQAILRITHPGQLAVDVDVAGVDGVKADGTFDLRHGEVLFKTAEFNGVSYDIRSSGKIEKVDLNTIPVNKASVQYLPVKINYEIKDTKGTETLGDDTLTSRAADAGAMKAYNLPYSLAFVTVNELGADKKRATAGAAARNFFDYSTSGTLGDLGAYQVVGYQSPYLPRNGRADYVGKSFGVDSVGDVKLRADFGATGAHIGGSVTNRTYADGTGTLPEIFLANIKLSQPGGNLNTTGTKLFGNEADEGAARARNDAGIWDVQLFGPDAEEAGGVISFFRNAGTPTNPNWVAIDSVIPGGIEVFTSQRGVITQDSNIAPTP